MPMRTPNRIILLLIIWICVLSAVSCTIQKRQRMPGYHIEWYTHSAEKGRFQEESHPDSYCRVRQTETENGKGDPQREDLVETNRHSRPSDFENEFVFYSRVLTNSLSKPKKDTCDLIITSRGEFLYVSSIEQDNKVIRFTTCGDSYGTSKVIAKDLVFMVKYKDGSKLVLSKSDSNKRSEIDQDKMRKPTAQRKNKGFRLIDEVSLVGLIFGVASIPVWLVHWQIGFFISIFAILMGVVGIIRIARSKGNRTGLAFAFASLVLGLGIFIATLIIHIAAFT